jgi:hypothetical protein
MNDDEFADLVESGNSPAAKRIAELEREVADLREILPKVLDALGNGSGCSPSCSVEFMRQIPKEVRLVVDGLKRELKQKRQDRKQANLGALRALGERNDARAMIDATTLKALPVGYIPTHTLESLPGRVADLVSELGRLTAMIEDPDEVELAMIRGDIAIPDRAEFDAIRKIKP